MAEFASVEYTAGYISSPRGNFLMYEDRPHYFFYTQAATGTAADTILLRVIPPHAMVDMYRSWLHFAGWTSGATLTIGWKAYKDEDGVTVAASAAGLLAAISLTVDGAWNGGMLQVATPDDSNPVAPGVKVFNNRDPVTLFATIGAQAPGAGDILNGFLMVLTS